MKVEEQHTKDMIGTKCLLCQEGTLELRGFLSKNLQCNSCASTWKVVLEEGQMKLTCLRINTMLNSFLSEVKEQKWTHTVEEWKIIGKEITRRRWRSVEIQKKLLELKEQAFAEVIYLGGHKFLFERNSVLCLSRENDKLYICYDGGVLLLTDKYQRKFALSATDINSLLKGEELPLLDADEFIEEVPLENLDLDKSSINVKSQTDYREIMAHSDLEMLGVWSLAKDLAGDDLIVQYEGFEIHVAYRDKNNVLQDLTLFAPTLINYKVIPQMQGIENAFHALMKDVVKIQSTRQIK